MDLSHTSRLLGTLAHQLASIRTLTEDELTEIKDLEGINTPLEVAAEFITFQGRIRAIWKGKDIL